MTESFLTIAGPAEGEYKEKGSKFFAFAFPVKDEEEIKNNLGVLKRKYHDARHHCYAYALNPEGDNFRANDDGEPSHSAGDPILGQIRSFGLTNVLVVVVRYFGGTKLGVGGLINAYRTAAETALAKAIIKNVKVRINYKMTYVYECTNEVMRLLNTMDIIIENQKFEEKCSMNIALAVDQQNEFLEKVKLLQDLGNDVSVHIL